jgi:hypothetical protein
MTAYIDERRINHSEKAKEKYDTGLVKQLAQYIAGATVATGLIFGEYQLYQANQPTPREYKNVTVIRKSNDSKYTIEERYDGNSDLVSSKKTKTKPYIYDPNNSNVIETILHDFSRYIAHEVVSDLFSN